MSSEGIDSNAMNFIQEVLNQLKDAQGNSVLPKFSKETVSGLYAIAYNFYEIGKYQDAVQFFRILTALDTQSRKNWMGLGASLQMLKEFEKAIEAYTVATLLDDEDPYVHMHAADCFFALNNMKKAIIALEAAEYVVGLNKAKYAHLLPQIQLFRKTWGR